MGTRLLAKSPPFTIVSLERSSRSRIA
jgi:hypothetical protein